MRRAVIQSLNFHPDDPDDQDWYRRHVEGLITQHGAKEVFQTIHDLRARVNLTHLDDFEVVLLWANAGWTNDIVPDRLQAFRTVVEAIPVEHDATAWETVLEAVDGSETMLTIPPAVLEKLGWQVGDALVCDTPNDRPYPYARIRKIA